MILFINVFITNQRRARITPDDRFEVFKYMLHSHSKIDRWSKAVIRCKLDKEYENKEGELKEYCENLFPDVSFYPDRVLKQRDWQEAVQEVLDYSDDLVWFLSNDDHILLDTELVDEAVSLLRQEDGMASMYFSHWPEVMRWYAGNPATRRVGANFVMAKRSVTDGIQLVNKALLRAWWFGENYGNSDMRRSDDIMLLTPGSQCTSPFEAAMYIPLKEMARHFDGYGHVGLRVPYFKSWSENVSLLTRDDCAVRPNQGGWVREYDAMPPKEWFDEQL